MRDFPIFETEYGVSSLALREIPYRNEAYIHIRAVQEGKEAEHLRECISFCRMAGAERIFAAGSGLETYPVYTAVLEMRGSVRFEPEMVENLFPVTEATVSRWREIHNRAMAGVDNGGTLEKRDEDEILKSGGAYFIHKNGGILGIGWIADNRLLAVAAVERGAGERIMHTLMSIIREEAMTLEVASTNHRALRLYERLGFAATGERIRWHWVWDSQRPVQ